MPFLNPEMVSSLAAVVEIIAMVNIQLWLKFLRVHDLVGIQFLSLLKHRHNPETSCKGLATSNPISFFKFGSTVITAGS